MFAFLSQLLFSLHSILRVVVVREGYSVSVPLGDIALAQVHADQVRKPQDVLDLEVLQLKISVENTEMEGVLKGHRVPGRRLFHLREIELIIRALLMLLSFRSLVRQLHTLKSPLILSAFKGLHETLGVCTVDQLFVALVVKVTQVADELLAVAFTVTRVVKLLVCERVCDNLDGTLVGLEFKKVVHNVGTGLIEFGHTELVEVCEPDFLDTKLDLSDRVVLHDLRDEVDVVLEISINASSHSLLLEELTEILTNWQVNKNVLVKRSVVVTFDRLYLADLGEHSKRIRHLKQLFDGSTTFKSFNHVDHVINLIPVKHLGQESI